MTYDVVVVGAGSAGVVLANRLSANPQRRVMLVEAGRDVVTASSAAAELRDVWGPDAFPARSEFDWGLVARKRHDDADSFALPRGRVIGGTGAVNAAIFLRALDDDFRQWGRLGLARWSRLDEVRAAFDAVTGRSSEPTTGAVPVTCAAPGSLRAEQSAFVDACAELGFARLDRLDAVEADGVGALPLNLASIDGAATRVRWNPAWAFLDASVRRRPNLSIACDERVVRIAFDGRRAVGIDVVTDGRVRRIPAGEVVLAAGAIHSPELLMRSGIGDARSLAQHGIAVIADCPSVGRNLRDHPAIVFECNALQDMSADLPSNQVALRSTSPASAHSGDLMLYPASRPHRRLFALRPTLNYAESAGRVLLARQDSGVDIAFDYLSSGTDTTRLAHAVRTAGELLATDTMRRCIDSSEASRIAALSEHELVAWLHANVRTGHHPFGTCRMGGSGDAAAVVDDEGRVHGVEALRVVDASILPPFVRANLHATVVMVAHRIARWMDSQ